MTDRNETLADVVAEIRFAVRGCSDGLPYSCNIGLMRELADRIEAASERAPDRQQKPAPFYVDIGTSIAAVRLSATHDVVARFDHSWRGKAAIDDAKRLCDRLNADVLPGNAAKLREALERIVNDIRVDGVKATTIFSLFHFYEVAKSALAATPRNCDRFATWQDAVQAFEQSVSPDWFKNWTKSDFLDCIKWLFAPAAQEGGDHADA